MAGDEAVETTTAVVDQIHKPLQQRLVAGTETMEVGFAETAGKAVAEENDQSKEHHEKQDLPPRTVLQQDDEKNKDEWNPRSSPRDGEHHVVQPHAVTAVESEQQLLVDMDEVVEQGVSNNFNVRALNPAFLTIAHANLHPFLHRVVLDFHAGTVVEDEEVCT